MKEHVDHIKVPAVYHGEKVMIDQGIYNLITTLWMHDVETTECCQGAGLNEEAYIRFSDLGSCAPFMRKLADRGINFKCVSMYTVKFDATLIQEIEEIWTGPK